MRPTVRASRLRHPSVNTAALFASVSSDLAARALHLATAQPVRAWFTPKSRSAKRIKVTDDFEVWLLGWLPGQGTDLHDHGGLSTPCPAGFAVAQGELTQYTVQPGEPPRLRSETVPAGTAATVDVTAVHAVVNHTDVPAVSVHVYAPRLAIMRRYLFDESGLWLSSMVRAGGSW